MKTCYYSGFVIFKAQTNFNSYLIYLLVRLMIGNAKLSSFNHLIIWINASIIILIIVIIVIAVINCNYLSVKFIRNLV